MKKSIVIQRPVEEVFAFLTDQSKVQLWQTGMVDSGLVSEGPMGVGAEYRATLETHGRRFVTSGIVTEFELNRKYSFKGTSGPFLISGSFSLEPVSLGTRVIFVSELKGTGFSKLAGPLIDSFMAGQMEEDLGRLKEALEADAGSSAR